MKYLVLALKGVAYGVTNLVPAIGGGTILILLHIYEQFVDAWGNLLNYRRWKEIIPFLFSWAWVLRCPWPFSPNTSIYFWNNTKPPPCSSSSACYWVRSPLC